MIYWFLPEWGVFSCAEEPQRTTYGLHNVYNQTIIEIVIVRLRLPAANDHSIWHNHSAAKNAQDMRECVNGD